MSFDVGGLLEEVRISDLSAWCVMTFSDMLANPLSCVCKLILDGEEITDLTIPESVTAINDYAFKGCTGFRSVTIPSSVTKIGSYAFSECSGLTRVTFNDGLECIGDHAFWLCQELASYTIPTSVLSVARFRS